MRAKKIQLGVNIFKAGLLCMILAVFTTACSRQRPVEKAIEEGFLFLGNGPEPQALDGHVTTGLTEMYIQAALFEGLVSPHPETLEPLPAVAKSWTISDDGQTYRFVLRDSAQWSDGKPVLAVDFVEAWRRALEPEQACPYAYMLYVLEGAESYNCGEETDFKSVGVKALDDRLLEVTLHQPVSYFPSLLLHVIWNPIPSHVFRDNEKDRIGSWTLPGTFVGNGPFVLENWLPNQYIEVRKNPLYWDVDTVKLKGIRYYALEEPGAEERAFLSGQVHVTNALPPARVKAYQRENSPYLRIDPYLGTYYVLVNTREGILSDPRIRRALSLAIDRKAIAGNLLGSGQRPAWGFVPDNMPGYSARIAQAYDPEEARRLLAEAGYPGGEGIPRMEYLFNSSESHRQIAEALQGMWNKELSIEITLTNQEWRTYLQRRASTDFELARAVWVGDYQEPSSFLDLWTSGSANNWAGWTDKAYDRLLEQAHRESNPVQRMVLYAKAEEVLIEDQAIIPLYFYVTVYLKDPRLKGWYGNLLGLHPVKYLGF